MASALTFAAALASLAVVAAAPAAPVSSCHAFASQAEAQARFSELGGSPARPLGRLDPDRDGVACEGLPGPYAGYATLGYNRAKSFLYGRVTMPPQAGGGFACLEGNRFGPEGPRLLRLFRVLSDGDRPVSREVGAAADPASGHLVWKLDLDGPPPAGRYYVAFGERIRLAPYGPNECPGFRSATVSLP